MVLSKQSRVRHWLIGIYIELIVICTTTITLFPQNLIVARTTRFRDPPHHRRGPEMVARQQFSHSPYFVHL